MSRSRTIATVPQGDVRLTGGRILVRRQEISPAPGSKGVWYTSGDGLRVLATMDSTPKHGRLLHLSASYVDHDPTWTDLRDLKDAFFGDQLDAMLVMPRAIDYVNAMPHCFHLWCMPEKWKLR